MRENYRTEIDAMIARVLPLAAAPGLMQLLALHRAGTASFGLASSRLVM